MAGIIGQLTDTIVSLLQDPGAGVNVRIAAMDSADSTLTTLGIQQILEGNVPVELTELSGPAQYPSLVIYCDRSANTMKEKFREYSGKVHVTVEVRHSQPLVSALSDNLLTYADAVCALLNDTRGDWDNGFFYAGGYDVSYQPVVRGGKNYLQSAKVGFDVEVSR